MQCQFFYRPPVPGVAKHGRRDRADWFDHTHALISQGHRLDDIADYTLGQFRAFLQAAARRDMRVRLNAALAMIDAQDQERMKKLIEDAGYGKP